MAIDLELRSKGVGASEVGETHNYLTVIGFQSPGGRIVVVRCVCGKEKSVCSSDLRHGKHASCGCKRVRHGGAVHGQKSITYRSWSGMRQRCLNPNAKGHENYGDRGISVDPSWDTFEQFLADMGPRPSRRHTIDRRDNNGPYCKDNCHWALPVVQHNNKRTNVVLEYKGRRQTVSQWAAELGIPDVTIYSRIKSGYSPEKALSLKTFLGTNQFKGASSDRS